jgi:hypothetical protein
MGGGEGENHKKHEHFSRSGEEKMGEEERREKSEEERRREKREEEKGEFNRDEEMI